MLQPVNGFSNRERNAVSLLDIWPPFVFGLRHFMRNWKDKRPEHYFAAIFLIFSGHEDANETIDCSVGFVGLIGRGDIGAVGGGTEKSFQKAKERGEESDVAVWFSCSFEVEVDYLLKVCGSPTHRESRRTQAEHFFGLDGATLFPLFQRKQMVSKYPNISYLKTRMQE